jgi:hypothetical protein
MRGVHPPFTVVLGSCWEGGGERSLVFDPFPCFARSRYDDESCWLSSGPACHQYRYRASQRGLPAHTQADQPNHGAWMGTSVSSLVTS